MFRANQIYSESAADVCERFNIELKTVAAHRPPSPQHKSAGTKKKKQKKWGKDVSHLRCRVLHTAYVFELDLNAPFLPN